MRVRERSGWLCSQEHTHRVVRFARPAKAPSLRVVMAFPDRFLQGTNARGERRKKHTPPITREKLTGAAGP
jgi:hypothetical protein